MGLSRFTLIRNSRPRARTLALLKTNIQWVGQFPEDTWFKFFGVVCYWILVAWSLSVIWGQNSVDQPTTGVSMYSPVTVAFKSSSKNNVNPSEPVKTTSSTKVVPKQTIKNPDMALKPSVDVEPSIETDLPFMSSLDEDPLEWVDPPAAELASLAEFDNRIPEVGPAVIPEVGPAGEPVPGIPEFKDMYRPGTLVISALLDSTGKVLFVQLRKSTGNALTDALYLEATRVYRFKDLDPPIPVGTVKWVTFPPIFFINEQSLIR